MRWDDYAHQTADGRYVRVGKQLTDRELKLHLRGKITLGTYCLSRNDTVRYTVLDADDDVAYHRLFQMANALQEEGIPAYMESSRRGGHLWFFHQGEVSGQRAKSFGEGLLARYELEMEVFPKQVTRRDGWGSLMRLPFGVHRKSGKRYPFVHIEDGLPIAPNVREQLQLLQYVHYVSPETVDIYSAFALNKGNNTERQQAVEADANIWTRIKAATPAVEFIGRYVELTPTTNGAIGHSPFHEDQVSSFAVNSDGNYWKCFAGCGGGSIIDFWMKWKKIELGEATTELKELLQVT